MAASETIDGWSSWCRETTGSSNTFEYAGTRYFFESSNREYADGAITGTVFRFIDATRCVKAGTFRIAGDGSVTRMPAAMRAAMAG